MPGKRIAFGVILAVLALMLGACASKGSAMVFDSNVPAENTAHIYIHPGIEITSYNGIPVPFKKNPLLHSGIRSEWHNVILPSGETEFIFNLGSKYGNTIYTGKDILFRYTFEPSEELYTLEFTPRGGDNKNERGIIVYKGAWPQVEKIAFVPFPRPERAILE